MLNVCLICSALLIVKVIFVITVFFLFLLCVSTILVNKDDHKCRKMAKPLPNSNLTVNTIYFSTVSCRRKCQENHFIMHPVVLLTKSVASHMKML